MSDFNLIKFEGKPMEKLLAIIHDFLGIHIEPKKAMKMADAEAYKIKVIERAKIDAKLEGETLQFISRLENRITAQETMKQINLESVLSKTAKGLSEREQVSDEKVDKDWLVRYFNIVENVGSDEMQELWAKILAGEIEKPNTFSLRTLDLLKNITQAEAKLFMKFCEYVIFNSYGGFVYHKHPIDKDMELEGLDFQAISLLQELNLISISARMMEVRVFGDYATSKLQYAHAQVEFTGNHEAYSFFVDAYVLSTIGFQLFKLNINEKISEKYFNRFLLELEKKDIKVWVSGY